MHEYIQYVCVSNSIISVPSERSATSTFLLPLGRWYARHATRVLATWALLIAALGGVVATTGIQLDDTFTISGIESMCGLEVLTGRLPQAADTSEQVLITNSDDRVENHTPATNVFTLRVSQIDDVAAASPPFGGETADVASSVSANGAHVLVQVQTDASVGSITTGATPRAKIVAQDLDTLAERAEAMDPSLTVQHSDNIDQEMGISISAIEFVGVAIIAIVLLITFGSLVAAGTPLIAAAVGVGANMLGILTIASFTGINSAAPVLAVMIGLAVGIDYTLFIVSQAREYLADGVDLAEAAGRATATSGGAIVLAGTTVIVALCGLSMTGIGFLTTTGLASAAVMAVAVLVALTVVPALVGLFGQRLLLRRCRATDAGANADRGSVSRWMRTVTRRPRVAIGAVVVLLGLYAVPTSGLRLILIGSDFTEERSQQYETYDAVAAAYSKGYNSPIVVIADISQPSGSVAVVQDPVHDLSQLGGVEGVSLAAPSEDRTLAFVRPRPEKSQANPSMMGLVCNIHSHVGDYESRYGPSNIMITGQTTVAIDVAEELNAALIPLSIVVVDLSLVLLTVVFCSIAVPVTAALGHLLPLGAGMGVVGAVFGQG